jgi:hypothetical protein|tara:strand:+ start:611 stop:1045 length:435 start_codon:yes stop_codon:yes gene_type:complete
MKITKTQLKQIIKEELDEAQKIPQTNKEKRKAIEIEAIKLAKQDGKEWKQIKDAKAYRYYRTIAAQSLEGLFDTPSEYAREDIDKEYAEDFMQRMQKIKELIHGGGFGMHFLKQSLPDPKLLKLVDDLDSSMGYIIQRLYDLTA